VFLGFLERRTGEHAADYFRVRPVGYVVLVFDDRTFVVFAANEVHGEALLVLDGVVVHNDGLAWIKPGRVYGLVFVNINILERPAERAAIFSEFGIEVADGLAFVGIHNGVDAETLFSLVLHRRADQISGIDL